MATFREMIELVDESRPNAISERLKFQWLKNLDGKIATDVMRMQITEIRENLNYRYPDSMDNELLVSFPHEDIYHLWLQAQIDAELGEYEKYQNTMQLYNAAYINFVHFFATEYELCSGCRHCGDEPPYYLTAYGLALKAGYQGSLEQWLESLKGVGIKNVEISASGELVIAYDDGRFTYAGYVTAYGIAVEQGYEGTAQQWLESLRGKPVELSYRGGMLQWRYVLTEGEDVWKDLLSVADLQGQVVAQTIAQAQEAKEVAAQAAKQAANDAQAVAAVSEDLPEVVRIVDGYSVPDIVTIWGFDKASVLVNGDSIFLHTGQIVEPNYSKPWEIGEQFEIYERIVCRDGQLIREYWKIGQDSKVTYKEEYVGVYVAGAKEGQAVMISSVNENGEPVAWEPVDWPQQPQQNVEIVTYDAELGEASHSSGQIAVRAREDKAVLFAHGGMVIPYVRRDLLPDEPTEGPAIFERIYEKDGKFYRDFARVDDERGCHFGTEEAEIATRTELGTKADKDVVSFPGCAIEQGLFPVQYNLNWSVLDRYRVYAGKTYRITGKGVMHRTGYPLAMFSEYPEISNTNIGTGVITEDTKTQKDYDVSFTPEADGYLFVARDSKPNTYGELSVSDKKLLKIQIFGDSMSDKNWPAADGVGATRWVDFLPRYLPDYALDISNAAVGGNTLVKYQPDAESGLYKGVAWQMTLAETTAGVPNSAEYGQYAPLLADRDLIIVWAGCNEWGVEGLLEDRAAMNPTVPLENIDITKMYGAVRSIIETVSTKTNAKLLFVTPVQRYTEDDSGLSVDADGNPLKWYEVNYKKPLVSIVDVIREACSFYGVPCLDMYREGSLNRYNIKDWTFDGLHANIAGAELFAEKIAGAIRNGVVGSGGSYGYSKAQIDAALGAYITDVAALVGGDA